MSLDYHRIAQSALAARTAENKQARLAPELRAVSLDDALAVQAQMIKQRQDGVAAWKCLLPPADDAVVVAPIFAGTMCRGDGCVLMPDGGKARVEPEIAFVLGRDLPAQNKARSDDEIRAAFDRAHMALELMQDRWQHAAELAFPEKLADGLFNQGIYLGPEVDLDKARSCSALNIEIAQAGKKQHFDGKHPNVDAFAPLLWMINFMSARGQSFSKGQAFITGSFCGIVELDFDCDTQITYQGLGSYTVNFSAR
ncbi:hydratase [Agaribacterium haliotis]|uniref:hydratase n=1 Tax=Agaribacterium haliotis TaxID=2013869 RepID=UPI000BB54288|nr:hydratase [Agaribacterium haliotis]